MYGAASSWDDAEQEGEERGGRRLLALLVARRVEYGIVCGALAADGELPTGTRSWDGKRREARGHRRVVGLAAGAPFDGQHLHAP